MFRAMYPKIRLRVDPYYEDLETKIIGKLNEIRKRVGEEYGLSISDKRVLEEWAKEISKLIGSYPKPVWVDIYIDMPSFDKVLFTARSSEQGVYDNYEDFVNTLNFINKDGNADKIEKVWIRLYDLAKEWDDVLYFRNEDKLDELLKKLRCGYERGKA